MISKNSLLLSLFLLSYTANAFNITHLLDHYPDFTTFNNYLTQTQLAAAINGRQTITVLVVDNAATSSLSGKPTDVLKMIMSVHVVLDYYDIMKLQKLPNKTAILTTLFQASGQAIGQQGFLNATDLTAGSVVLGSAVHGSQLSANLVKSVASQPYNISVLQISTVIIPPGIDGSPTNSSSNSTAPKVSPAPSPRKPTTPPSMSPEKSPTTAPLQPSEAPAPSKATADSPAPSNAKANAPAPSNAKADAPAPSNATADAPAPSNATADAPTMDAPTPAVEVPGSPPKPADGPTADAPAADATAADAPAANAAAGTPPSAGVALRLSARVVLAIVLWTLSLLSMN